jgi:hypothetical protein
MVQNAFVKHGMRNFWLVPFCGCFLYSADTAVHRLLSVSYCYVFMRLQDNNFDVSVNHTPITHPYVLGVITEAVKHPQFYFVNNEVRISNKL